MRRIRRGLVAGCATAAASLVFSTVAGAVPAGYNAKSNTARGTGSDTLYQVMVNLSTAYNESEGCRQHEPRFPHDDVNFPNNTCVPDADQAANVVTTENFDHEVTFNFFPYGSTSGRAVLCNRVPDSIKPPNLQLADWSRSSSAPPASGSNPCSFSAPIGTGSTPTAGAPSGLTLRWIGFARDSLTHTTFRTPDSGTTGLAASGGGTNLTPAPNDAAGTGPNLQHTVIVGIFSTCTVKDWRQIDRATGGLSTTYTLPANYNAYTNPEADPTNPGFPANGGQPILAWTAIPGSGTRPTWDAFLGSGANSANCLPAWLKNVDPDDGERVIREHFMQPVRQSTDINGPNNPCTGPTNPPGYTPPPGTPACPAPLPDSRISNPAPNYASNEGNSIYYMSPGLWRTQPELAQNSSLGAVDGIYPTEAAVTATTGGFRYARTLYNVIRQSCRNTSTGAQTTDTSLCADIPGNPGLKPVLAIPAARQFVGNNGWICKGRAAHSRPPGAPGGLDNLGVVSTGASRNYGAVVIAAIRSTGFVPLRDPADGSNICDFTDRMVP